MFPRIPRTWPLQPPKQQPVPYFVMAFVAIGLIVTAIVVPIELTQAHHPHHHGQYDSSPPKYPSPWGTGSGDWADAYAKARAFVSDLTLLEKVNLTTGTG